ncbi:MAG TPA: hypothetical protein VFC21_10195, partial [Bryobacteraceae bacterium]|nr:hypothetical protein [Bryobacteraceae bacterium]
MNIPFVKLHGAKNDFLLTKTRDAPGAGLPAIALAICDRYTGVGADGWILVDPTAGPDYEASIRLFNSDGSEPELSGNGTRCAAALLLRDQPYKEVRIRTGAGTKALVLVERRGPEYWFRMDMGSVRVAELHAIVQGRAAVILDVGNPQCAIPVDDFDFDWRAAGAAVERDLRCANRTNVSFIRAIGRHS